MLGAGTGFIFLLSIEKAGPAAVLLPAAGLVAAFLISRPRIALAALLGVVVVIEGDPIGLIPIGPTFYEPIRYGITPPDVLLALIVAGTAFELMRTRSYPRGIGPMTLPMLALTGAFAAGLGTGYLAGASPNDLVLSGVRSAHLLLLPFVCANLLLTHDSLRAFLAGAAGLAAFKAVSGLAAVAAGAGFAVDGGTITYYEPLANWLLLMLLLVAIAARAREVPLPGWVHWAVPIALLAFLLSYRRSFWLAALFAIVFVLVVASRQRMRTAVVVAGVGLAIVLAATLTLGQGSNLQSPVVERARSLEPGRLSSTAGDRYRLDEQRNVIDELTRHPFTGIGMNVPWTVRHPLSQEHDRNYTHVVLLWYWLKLGLLGVFAYMWLIGMAIWTAFLVWRQHADGLIQVAGLAAAGGLAALAIVELTASFTGVEPRLTTAVGGLLGFIAAAWRDLPQQRIARATASTE